MRHVSKLLLLLVVLLTSCKEAKENTTETLKQTAVADFYKLQQTLYYGGDIITMAGEKPTYVEAVVQREGKIIFTGSKADAFARFEGKVARVDLQGKDYVAWIYRCTCALFKLLFTSYWSSNITSTRCWS